MNTETPEATGRRQMLRRQKAAERAEWVRRYEASGQGRAEFAAANGFSAKSLERWIVEQRKRVPRFAAVTVAMGAPFELTFPTGVRLAVRPAGTRAECVALLRELAGC